MRSAGVLLHPTSLPSPGPIGDIGPTAHRFVEWLAEAGCSLWQVLPLNPAGPGYCPYTSASAFAAEPRLLSIELLLRDELLEGREVGSSEVPRSGDRIDDNAVRGWKEPLLHRAAERLAAGDPAALSAYAEANPWAADWALYAALSEQKEAGWWAWPEAGLRKRSASSLSSARKKLSNAVNRHLALQLLFDRQWGELRQRADRYGVKIVGDIPIFVSGDGCDTWAHRKLFKLDAEGQPTVVAGVPPDYFSPTGQLWGNPHYDWAAHQASGFSWWKDRFARVLHHVHRVRVDHFRGFAAAWAVDPKAETAREGRWVRGPGKALFDALGELPLIAEDLGIITPDVHALREAIGAPGMKILQFGFVGSSKHPFLPHNFTSTRCVVYTGTHDNETSRGWYNAAHEAVRHRFRVTLSRDGSDVSWDMIRLAYSSIADDAIAPMQDVLSLGNEGRMNVPGEPKGNWLWRFTDVPSWAAGRLREMAWAYGRLPEQQAEVEPQEQVGDYAVEA